MRLIKGLIKGVDKVDILTGKMAESVPFSDQNINLINFYQLLSTF